MEHMDKRILFVDLNTKKVERLEAGLVRRGYRLFKAELSYNSFFSFVSLILAQTLEGEWILGDVENKVSKSPLPPLLTRGRLAPGRVWGRICHHSR